jgi:ABC-type sugar transport system ATPase subunit
MPRLVFDRVRKTYPGGPRAVDDVSLAVEDGELLVLVGPSGCGKTTLLRLAAGLERPDAGRILLAGRDLAGVAPAGRRVALVFQSHALHPARSVYDNLAFALRLARTPAAETDDRVRRMAGRLGLEPVLHARPGQLSGGQQQRVALGKALVRRPEVFLLDEPLSNLDAALRRDLRQLIRELQSELRVPTVLVTHDQEEALSLADRLVVLDAGRVLQAGPPADVYRRPACRFVAGFLGSPPMNFLDGGLVRRPGVVLGVRPEALALAQAGPDAFAFTGRVLLAEQLGDRVDVVLELAGAARLTVRLPAGQPPAEGGALTVFARPDDCRWFAPGPDGKAVDA